MEAILRCFCWFGYHFDNTTERLLPLHFLEHSSHDSSYDNWTTTIWTPSMTTLALAPMSNMVPDTGSVPSWLNHTSTKRTWCQRGCSSNDSIDHQGWHPTSIMVPAPISAPILITAPIMITALSPISTWSRIQAPGLDLYWIAQVYLNRNCTTSIRARRQHNLWFSTKPSQSERHPFQSPVKNISALTTELGTAVASCLKGYFALVFFFFQHHDKLNNFLSVHFCSSHRCLLFVIRYLFYQKASNLKPQLSNNHLTWLVLLSTDKKIIGTIINTMKQAKNHPWPIPKKNTNVSWRESGSPALTTDTTSGETRCGTAFAEKRRRQSSTKTVTIDNQHTYQILALKNLSDK